MANPMSTEMLFWVYHREVYLALYFSYCIDRVNFLFSETRTKSLRRDGALQFLSLFP